MNIVLDFDGTISTKDTIGNLADAAIAFQKKTKGVDLQQPWDAIVKGYFDDLAVFRRGYKPAEADRTSIADELRYLTHLCGVEMTSIERVEKAGLFAGLTQEDLFGMGAAKAAEGAVAVRPGLREMLRLTWSRGWRTSLLSVNWSGSFIRGVLHAHGIECATLGIEVLANEADGEGRVCGPGILGQGRRLTTSADKRECLEKMLNGRGRGTGESAGDKTLYMGDSPTDLACLLYGRGVVMADDEGSAVLQTLRRLGVRVPHVGDEDGDGADVVWARDFREVLQSKMMTAMDAPGRAA